MWLQSLTIIYWGQHPTYLQWCPTLPDWLFPCVARPVHRTDLGTARGGMLVTCSSSTSVQSWITFRSSVSNQCSPSTLGSLRLCATATSLNAHWSVLSLHFILYSTLLLWFFGRIWSSSVPSGTSKFTQRGVLNCQFKSDCCFRLPKPFPLKTGQ